MDSDRMVDSKPKSSQDIWTLTGWLTVSLRAVRTYGL